MDCKASFVSMFSLSRFNRSILFLILSAIVVSSKGLGFKTLSFAKLILLFISEISVFIASNLLEYSVFCLFNPSIIALIFPFRLTALPQRISAHNNMLHTPFFPSDIPPVKCCFKSQKSASSISSCFLGRFKLTLIFSFT